MNRIPGGVVLAAVVALTFVAGGAAHPGDPPAKGPAELQGCWKLVSIEGNGVAVEPFGGGLPRWVVKGDKVFYGGEEVIQLAADPSTSPRVIDLKFRDPERVYEGIYEVEKDTLKVCVHRLSDGTKARPGAFATKDQRDWRLLVFEREKAAPANPTEGLTAYAGVRLRGDADTKTVLVDAPIKGSPAEKAGLKADDVILTVGGKAVASADAAVQAVREAKPGEKVAFRVRRGDKEMDITVTVGVFPFYWAIGLE